MRTLLVGFVCVVVCCVPVAAQWYTSLYIGAAHTSNSYLDVRQTSLATNLHFSNVAYEGESFQSPLYYGLQVGNFFTSHFGLNAEFTHLKVFSKVAEAVGTTGVLNGVPINAVQPMDAIVQHFAISHGVNLLTANAMWRQQFWKRPSERAGRLNVFFELGAGVTIPHAESIIQLQQDEHYQVGSPAFQVGAGADVRVKGRLHWMAEYKYTRVDEKVSVNQGTAETLLHTNHVVTGPMVYF